jgi:hypothetical protein
MEILTTPTVYIPNSGNCGKARRRQSGGLALLAIPGADHDLAAECLTCNEHLQIKRPLWNEHQSVARRATDISPFVSQLRRFNKLFLRKLGIATGTEMTSDRDTPSSLECSDPQQS